MTRNVIQRTDVSGLARLKSQRAALSFDAKVELHHAVEKLTRDQLDEFLIGGVMVDHYAVYLVWIPRQQKYFTAVVGNDDGGWVMLLEVGDLTPSMRPPSAQTKQQWFDTMKQDAAVAVPLSDTEPSRLL